MQGNIINQYLGSSFGQLQEMGEQAYRPFMEDRLQWSTLSRLIAWQLLHAPGSILQMTLFMKVHLNIPPRHTSSSLSVAKRFGLDPFGPG